jgi:hypothetical protein
MLYLPVQTPRRPREQSGGSRGPECQPWPSISGAPMNHATSLPAIYQLMRHLPTDQYYACRIEGVRITGCLGPQKPCWWRVVDLTVLPYEENSDLVPWANEHLAEFDLTR